MTTAANQYNPDYAVPPGWVLEEELEAKGISLAEFARLCGLSAKSIGEIIAGKAPIEPETATKFDRVLGGGPDIWLRMESTYRLRLAQQGASKPTMPNTLFYGDNLQVLRDHVPAESVDLVYLDPPFNSNASYNVLFRERTGEESPAQIKAFTDTWEWTQETERTFELDIIQNPAVPSPVKDMISAFRQFIGRNAMMAYLVMMAPRLVELHRVLKPTGSLYLHCDPTAGHYLKILLDTTFGARNFRNEIVWPRTNAHHDAKRYGRIHDVIFYYSKSRTTSWNPVYTPYTSEQIDDHYSHVEEVSGRRFRLSDVSAQKPGGDVEYEWNGVYPPRGRYWAYSKTNMEAFEREGRLYYTRNGRPFLKRYLDEMPGNPAQDVWSDVPFIHGSSAELLGYKTQKPEALLERIIQASSNEGDVVLDPSAGAGRRWRRRTSWDGSGWASTLPTWQWR